MKSIKKTAWIMPIILALTLYLIFRKIEVSVITREVKNADIKYLLIGIIPMVLFVLSEAINIGRGLRLLGNRPAFINLIKYSCCGFFFSGITPSASGGQPMVIYSMHKDGIKGTHGTVALIGEFISFQGSSILICLTGLLLYGKRVASFSGTGLNLMILGFTASILVWIFAVLSVFCPKTVEIILRFVVKLLKNISLKFSSKIEDKFKAVIEDYAESANVFSSSKKCFFGYFATSLIQLISLYSVGYFVYMALGLRGENPIYIILLQGILYTAVMALPLPGGTGAGEGGFILLFSSVFADKVFAGAILYRFLSFYLILILTFTVFLLCHFIGNKEKKDELQYFSSGR